MNDLRDYAEWIRNPANQLARRSDPETSHEAAEKARDFRGQQHAQILRVMGKACRSMASEEIANALGWSEHVPGRRMIELERAGKIEVAENDFHINASGRRARRYRLKVQP